MLILNTIVQSINCTEYVYFFCYSSGSFLYFYLSTCICKYEIVINRKKTNCTINGL